jgi:hypothetical protein
MRLRRWALGNGQWAMAHEARRTWLAFLRFSAVVDAGFRLIVDRKTALSGRARKARKN